MCTDKCLHSYCSNRGSKVNIEMHIDWSTLTTTAPLTTVLLNNQGRKLYSLSLSSFDVIQFLITLYSCSPNCQHVKVASLLQIWLCFIYRFGCFKLNYIIFLRSLKFEFWRTVHGRQAPTLWQNYYSSLTGAFEKLRYVAFNVIIFLCLLSALPSAPWTNLLPSNGFPWNLIVVFTTKIRHEN
jgi:hypothetical protein